MKKILGFVLVMIFFSVFAIGCKQKEVSNKQQQATSKTEVVQNEEQKESSQKISTFSLSGTSQNERKWIIEGKSADILSSDIVKLEDITGKTYLEKNVVTITSNKGQLDRKTNNLTLIENVIATTEDGAELTTERLNWSAEGEYVWTEDFITITKNNIITTGYGAEGYPDLDKVKLKKNVKINIGKSTTVNCAGPLKIDYEEAKGFLYNDIQVVNGEKGKLVADEAIVFFSKDNQKIEKIIALGNVRIERGLNITFSNQATYLVNEKKMILTGKPKLLAYSKDYN
jgi:LPS export ABC transporter protein LptC